MENIEIAERNVVEVNSVTVDLSVIGKDAEIEMNNNNNNEGVLASKNEGLMVVKDVMPSEEPTMVETVSEKMMSDEMAKEELKHTDSEMGSMNTDNGNATSVENEPTEGDLKVELASVSEMNDEKTESSEISEQTEASEPSSSYATDSESKDDTQIESESGTSENTTENSTENTVETSEPNEVTPSEQSGDNAHQNEAKKEEEEGTVTAAEKKDDAQTETEQKSDDANETVKSDSSKRSPRKKGTNKKRKNRSRSQKKQTDYSDLVKYTVSVSQRQRRYTLHVPRGRVINAPGDDCEIFCSNIPINVLEGELIPLFERYGKIWELRLMMSLRNPKRNAGFAFVRYTSNKSATEATEKLNNYEILPGKLIAIRLSQPNLSLFVGNIHRGLTREQIHEKIGSRTNGLVKTFVKTSLYEDTKNCGFCFLEYDSHSAALKAKRLLNQGNVWGRQLFVDWAQRRKQPEESDLIESKTLFINNLPKETTDELITETLSSYGTIEKITKIKDYAFVLFEEHQSAENAMNGVDKTKLGNEKVEISMAMPKSMKSRPRFSSFPSYRKNSHHQRRSGRNRGSNHFKGFNTSFGSSTSTNKFYMRKQHKPKKVGGNSDAAGTIVEQTIIPMPIGTTSAAETLAN
ncbi:heterogeneous nuclear ribonucleoprotein R-like [Sitodiplosis mosellana]|uniref:heterogeneous nuclear ribonucleoprotein R-like n=1 Tax=Sitodiplosis mosellana TaxID=263140 RepID=UPI002444A203|nr:heterogeneous nuclear ribonucleoprotein R-like [Sitodiplosis mosellana]